ncbi:MAG: primosomal protein N' [Chloroflexi bacterium]|nr:primosomal protein N' [Chloroflexota bacterium]MBM3172276.1 primosomal protein N' [Chloroflexota bacterium]MBM3174748.1 primosomal protein N' [Chloroflexota bacterium]MBM4449839.1 primosomal protein N' [Chloroflexota bacterium]
MKYAEVAVNSPIAQRRSFCYSVPLCLDVDVGQAVWVPFGSVVLQGIVLRTSSIPSFEITKEVIGVITPSPLLSLVHVDLALWLSTHYVAPLFDSLALMLPPGFERRLVTVFHLPPGSRDLSQLNEEQRRVVCFIGENGKISSGELKRKLGRRKAELVIGQLLRHGLIVKTQQLGEVRVKPKLVRYLKLQAEPANAEAEMVRLKERRAYKQAAVIDFLLKQAHPVPLSDLRRTTACTEATLNSLEKQGLIATVDVQVRRDPLEGFRVTAMSLPVLTPSQEAAWQQIRVGLRQRGQGEPPIFLLHGVTGSGKTEIYLRALEEVVRQGRRGICLVPEISLTPQTIERFVARFPGLVAVLHSGLSLGEQYDEWYRIKEGNCAVVIGPRSALFAPQPDLGLIIIDEEHEWTYKQSDKSPRYHAREAAIRLAELSGAAVILGSATPDVVTYYRSKQGIYQVIELKERVTPAGIASLPDVEVVDMREELKAGNRSLFSRSLCESIQEALVRRGQIILFLNRRGTATLVECRVCGFVLCCRHCSASLVYHGTLKKLVCHHCRYTSQIPAFCPSCHSRQLKFLGVGTQRVEEEVRSLFPQARILRWDRDVAPGHKAYKELLDKFRNHQADVLIGTQMVAKGLDLPQVTLTGVVSADTGLNIPDFRAGERTFQLLCQVAGRAGRGLVAGKVIIQTYSPGHYAIRAAANHDYEAFYAQEIEYRRQLAYPPFSRLVRLLFRHTNAGVCQREAEKMCRAIINEKNRRGIPDLRVIGPSPAFVSRLRGHYQWQILVCGTAPVEILSDMAFPQGWILDIDPVGVV